MFISSSSEADSTFDSYLQSPIGSSQSTSLAVLPSPTSKNCNRNTIDFYFEIIIPENSIIKIDMLKGKIYLNDIQGYA